MKILLPLGALAVGLLAASAEPAGAVVYCSYTGYPSGCVARAGVAYRARPVAGVGVGAPGVGVRPGRPMNRGGPVNRVGRR